MDKMPVAPAGHPFAVDEVMRCRHGSAHSSTQFRRTQRLGWMNQELIYRASALGYSKGSGMDASIVDVSSVCLWISQGAWPGYIKSCVRQA